MASKSTTPVMHRLNNVDDARLQHYFSLFYKALSLMEENEETVVTFREHEGFWRKHMRYTKSNADSDDKRLLKRLCFEDIPELIDAMGLTWKRLLEIVATEDPDKPVKLEWSNEWEAKLCELLDQSNSEFRAKALKLVKQSTPPAFKEAAEYPDMRTQNKKRLFEYSHICGPRQAATGEIMKELNLTSVYKYRNHANDEGFITFSLSLIHTIYTSFGVSPHWLLGLGNTACVLAENVETEQVLDYFCMLPEAWQEVIYKGISRSCASAGEL